MTDYYVTFGEKTRRRRWEDARRYGFVSAGGGWWYSRTLFKLLPGDRIFVLIPKVGYVGVGEVVAPAVRVDDFVVAGGAEPRGGEHARRGSGTAATDDVAGGAEPRSGEHARRGSGTAATDDVAGGAEPRGGEHARRGSGTAATDDHEHDGREVPILRAELVADRMHVGRHDHEQSEYLVRVRWIETLDREDAVWIPGMFGNQNTVCLLRHEFTRDVLLQHFDLPDAAEPVEESAGA